jgi:hypothetical protein
MAYELILRKYKSKFMKTLYLVSLYQNKHNILSTKYNNIDIFIQIKDKFSIINCTYRK